MHAALVARITATFADEATDFDVSLRIYGWNAVQGRKFPRSGAPRESEYCSWSLRARRISPIEWPRRATLLLSLPLRSNGELPSYAFPFTPAKFRVAGFTSLC